MTLVPPHNALKRLEKWRPAGYGRTASCRSCVLTLFLLLARLHICDLIQILDLYAKKLKLAPTVDLGSIARSTAGMTGADLTHLLHSSALRASALDKPAITNEDIEYTKGALAFWQI